MLHVSYKIATFYTRPNWETVEIPFNKFKKLTNKINTTVSAKDIKTTGIIAYGRDFILDLSSFIFRVLSLISYLTG